MFQKSMRYYSRNIISRNLSSFKGKNLMCISDLSVSELDGLIQHSIDIKTSFKNDPINAR